ncbi:MAG: type II toxin-antitoxin system RelE/ParE family toxin [Parvularculaceae bacterium]
MNVNFTPTARADLKAIRAYISEFDDAAADRVISRIRQAAQMFESFPLLGRAGEIENTRELTIPGLPYIIVYAIASETEIDVLTIIHGRQQYPPA